MNRFNRWVTTVVVLYVSLGALPSWGQSSAEVRGKVTDPSHKPVVAA